MKTAFQCALAMILIVASAQVCPAQACNFFGANVKRAVPSALSFPFLSVMVNNGSSVNVPLSANRAVNPGSTTTSITTCWITINQTITVWAYFSSPNAALLHQTVGNTMDIPSSAVKIQVDGAGPFAPLTNVNPFTGTASGLQIGRPIVVNFFNFIGSRTDVLGYQVDTSLIPQLPADTYSGTLVIQAQALP